MASFAADKNQQLIMGIWIVSILVVSMLIAYLLLHFGYHITEEKHREIVEELEQRHAKNGLAEEVPLAPEAALGVGQEPNQVETLNKDE